MSDGIIVDTSPNMKAVDLGDGTFAYATVAEQAQDRGIATGGSNTTCADTTKSWIVNHYAGDTLEVVIAGVEYFGLIASNTATVITMGALGTGAIVTAGDPYKIKSAAGAEATIADGADVTQGTIADAVVVAGAAGTLSAKLRRVTTDIGALLGVSGAVGDATVAAGAVGTISAKLRRLTTDVAALLTGTILAAGTAIIGRVLPIATVETPYTGSGNMVVGTENIAPGAAYELTEIHLHLSAAPTTGTQNLVLTVDNGVAAAYDLVILTIDLVANAVTDLVVKPNTTLKAGDVVTAAWTNTDSRTYGLIFKHKLI